jgi:hypothetical protein
MNTVTCHTDGCANSGITIDMQLSFDVVDIDGTTTTYTVGSVSCGICGQPITDIEPPLDRPPDAS